MERVNINVNLSNEDREFYRHLRFKNLSAEDKMKELCHLIETMQLFSDQSESKQVKPRIKIKGQN